jgi:hypothetical protein
VVAGEPLPRGDADADKPLQDDGLPQPDRVEVWVRTLNDTAYAVVRMAQFKAGQELLVIEIEDVRIDQPMAETSFKLDARGKRVIDVMEHPPAAAQIKSMLEKAKLRRDEGGKASGK